MNDTDTTPQRNKVVPLRLFDPKSPKIMVWQNKGSFLASDGRGKDWVVDGDLITPTGKSYLLHIFDTPTTGYEMLPRLRPEVRNAIELELDNHTSGISVVATHELEKLHKLPEGERPDITDWYRWYKCRKLPRLRPYFMAKGSDFNLDDWLIFSNNASSEGCYGWLLEMKRREALRKAEPGLTCQDRQYDGVLLRMDLTSFNHLTTVHCVEGRLTSGNERDGVLLRLTPRHTWDTSWSQHHRNAPLDLLH